MPYYKTKNKKDGIFQYRVVVNFTDAQGNYRKKESTAWGLQAAKEKEIELTQQLKSSDNNTMTVAQLANDYLNAKKYEVKESTLDKSNRILNDKVIPVLGSIRINKLTPKVLTDWKQHIESQGLALQTRQNTYSEFNALLNYAFRMEYLPANPLKKVGNFKGTLELEKPLQYYTADQYKLYAAAVHQLCAINGNFAFYVFFSIAYYTGARKGEINALRWADINGDTLSISKSINQKLKGGDRETPPKNKSSIRKIKLPQPLILILNDHKSTQQTNDPEYWSLDKFICGYDKPLRDTTLDVFNRNAAQTANLHRIRIHDFRHTHASILIDGGIAITEISRRLGHADITETLNTYAHFFPQQEEKALEVLNNA